LLLGALPARAAAGGTSVPSTATRTAATSGRAGQAQPARRAVVLAFIPATERALSRVDGLSLGLMSATQGSYTREQMLLDVGQGARIASSAYGTSDPPPLSIAPQSSGDRAAVTGWGAAVARARAAPQLLRPGLLASTVTGGAAYAGIAGTDDLDALAAADRAGRVVALSLGSASSLVARITALRGRRALVICDLPPGRRGIADLRALSERRAPAELLLVVQRASERAGDELLWAGAAGLAGGAGRELTSRTTSERGLLSAIDLAPTILAHLGMPIPADVRGARLEADGPLHSASLRSLRVRLAVVGGRRLKALGCLLATWALMLLLAAMPSGPRGRASRRWAMRVGALALMWAPVAALVGAALQPSAGVEYATIVLVCFVLAALSDAWLAWPRAPLGPATVAVVALVVDALAGSQLLMRSLLGPNPILGARFYGFGNELKSGLAVLVLSSLAAALFPLRRPRRGAIAMALVGIALAAIEGAARIGAGVGGLILVSAGFAVATIMLLPGDFSRRRALTALAAPLVALVALAALDLLTAHGSGHYTGSILHARSPGDLRDVIVRRYGAAWRELKNHAMPAAAVLAVAYGGYAVRDRARLLAPVGGDRAWMAVLAGGLTAGVVGALSEDSGPVLLVVAVFVLGCVATYLWGRPAAIVSPSASRPAAQVEEI
jgi:hypothetical protein